MIDDQRGSHVWYVDHATNGLQHDVLSPPNIFPTYETCHISPRYLSASPFLPLPALYRMDKRARQGRTPNSLNALAVSEA